MSIRFSNTYSQLPGHFYERQKPTPVASPRLIRANQPLAAELGIASGWLESAEALGVFSGNVVPPGADPIAQAYAGHQFANFVPQLGDGRAILLGEVKADDGRRRDIVLKGAGRTPFSRGGDGRSALGPVLREYIVSEAMYALGVPTTRALAAVSSGELVAREELQPGGIFTRVATSHIRVGTFQYFAAQQDYTALNQLTNYALSCHRPELPNPDNPALALLEYVIRAQAKLVAKWLPFGFIHGVMNTDNVSISGETLDYGPCAFMDTFHPEKTFSYIDRRQRYAWGNQPNICHWNLTRLAEALLPVIDPDLKIAKKLAGSALEKFPDLFQEEYLGNFRKKFGLPMDVPTPDLRSFVKTCLALLARHEIDFTLFFRKLTLLAENGEDRISSLFIDQTELDRCLDSWKTLCRNSPNIEDMKAANPVYIPRNHQIERAIQAALKEDFQPFHRLVDVPKCTLY